MARLRITFAFLALCSITFAAEPQPPTLRLPDTVAPTSYRVELTLNTDQSHFNGFIAIKLDIKKPEQVIWLNGTGLTIQEASLKSGSKSMTAKAIPGGNDFVGFQFDSDVPEGAAELDIRYTGTVRLQDSSGVFRMEENGNRYLFTQFESTDARGAFPCFDEPSYKVPWQLTLNIPQEASAVSNTPPLKEQTQGDRKIVAFKQTKPLPSYLVAFAVGPFDFVNAGTAGVNHVPVRIVTPKGHAEDAKYAAEVTATILTRLENYFGIPYPYEKSDEVAIPSTYGFGAMENAGMVTYAQTILLANPARDTIMRQRECASVEAHELAHQWFGDLVTTAWWNDIWLNEAFATWMEQKILAEWKPEWKTRVEDVDSKLRAEAEDSLISARRIRQPIESKNDISNAFDTITYQKGAAVIGMFENWVGPEEFRKGVHAYLTQYAFKNATAPEFLDSVSSASGKPITKPFSTFLNQAGVPLLSASLDCNQGSPVLHLEQQRFLPLGSKGSADQLWQIPVCVRDGSGQSECTLMTQPKQDWTLKAKSCPAWVEANKNAVGYYRVDYSKQLLSALTSGDVEQRLNAPERVDFMGDAEALSSAGKLPAADALGLVNTFHSDPEHYVVQNALNLALAPRAHLVPNDLMPNYERFLRQNFQQRAREMGWIPKPGESDDVRLLRPNLVAIVATDGGDRELAKQGQELADKWFQNRDSVNPNMVGAVLGTAAFYGDKNLLDRFLAEFKKTSDRQERQRMMRAMISFRDPEAVKAIMQAVLSGEIPFIQGGGYLLVYAGQSSAATRKIPFEFVKEHFDEIAAKRPTGGGFDFGALLPRVGQSFCDAESRDELKDFFEPRVNKFIGAPRTLSQVLEGINVCIAEKAAQEPSVVAFLKKY
ncbi:MAG TPA: M1 family metallopeptidase [Bryobacteraceae bacterium]|jgi:alanyl aminopeptidase|nr:M1 family metallopeptidase [Bryobacteraceae bacterium]